MQKEALNQENKINILVTGAAGFIGQPFSLLLKKASYNVFALDHKRPTNFDGKGLKNFFEQDITKAFKLNQTFDYIFHFAACNLTHVGAVDYKTYYLTNVQGTENLIRSTQTKYFILMSTTKVYKCGAGSIDETSPLAPSDHYAKSKLEAEVICQRYFSKKTLTIFRATNIVGPGQAEKAIIPIFFKKAYCHDPLEIVGCKKTIFQPLYIDDLIEAFLLFLRHGKGQGIVNLSSSETITLGELAQRVIDICHSKSKICCFSEEEAPFTKIIAQKAKKKLGWEARTSIQKMLENYHQFYLKKG